MSETFSTLHGLVLKGVKVVMDIPYELWNETSAEVADLKKQYEEVLEDWYKGSQEEDLTTYLCEKHVLKGQDQACLKEEWNGKKGDQAAIAEDKKKKQKKKKKKKGLKKGKEGGGEGGESSVDGEKSLKKKKRKKSKSGEERREERREGGLSDEDIQGKVSLSGGKTEL